MNDCEFKREVRFLKRFCVGFIISTAALCGLVGYSSYTKRRWLESQTMSAMQAQHEKLGLNYWSVPTAEWFSGFNLGEYDAEKNKISVQNGLSTEETISVLHHELGHAYVDQLNERRGKGNFPLSETKTISEAIAIKIVNEGIAEYIETAMGGEARSFSDAEWPQRLGEFTWNDHVIYDGGRHLVKPIIDKHGPKGIEYLIDNLPRAEELLDLPGYQRRILEELEKKVSE